MAELDAAARGNLPDSDFAGPDRSYPVNDAEHAANAKGRATQQVKKGTLSAATAKRIKRKADRILAKGKMRPPPPEELPDVPDLDADGM